MNIGSSLGETEQFPIREPRLIDVIVALEKRDRQDEANYYREVYPMLINIIYDIPEDKVLSMAVDDIAKLIKQPIKPLKYEGWDTFFFGKATFNDTY